MSHQTNSPTPGTTVKVSPTHGVISGLAAGQAIRLRYNNAVAGTANFRWRILQVRPVVVG